VHLPLSVGDFFQQNRHVGVRGWAGLYGRKIVFLRHETGIAFFFEVGQYRALRYCNVTVEPTLPLGPTEPENFFSKVSVIAQTETAKMKLNIAK